MLKLLLEAFEGLPGPIEDGYDPHHNQWDMSKEQEARTCVRQYRVHRVVGRVAATTF